MSKTTKTISYECLCERDGLVFYDEGYSSLKKAQAAMLRMKEESDKRESTLGPAHNFRIVKHEITDRETVVKTYPEWEK